ncbi:conserved membrane protein of unknown function [Vibrio tapetis subsp. tapetis]|uniref:DUF445 domain-containing protein n=2 Tax=Vibrio tapetis TaxID=52443 RepID=A0A2N8ZK56_9VIBR|nr:conserved membrane protein of unknown function [Vibrio tapetis subsp. tapetis]
MQLHLFCLQFQPLFLSLTLAIMNKSLITNLVALSLLVAGYVSGNQLALYAGLFAFSGAITNWLAIHMLFEKVPGLYGSGVIPARFEEFKAAIKTLMMQQFFTNENIDRFLSKEMDAGKALNLEPIIEKIDFETTYDSLVDVINNSQFGSMLAMFGGSEALEPLKAPFIEKMKESVIDISKSDAIKDALKEQLEQPEMLGEIESNIENIIDQRLNELTPQLVKSMVQDMIKAHLGWLVVWGGIFGGIIGVISSFIA